MNNQLDIPALIKECHQIAVDHGWWEPQDGQPRSTDELVCLLHSEVSEAFEEYRKHKPLDLIYFNEDDPKPEGIPIEFADVIIRCCDVLGSEGIHEIVLDQLCHDGNIGFSRFCAILHRDISTCLKECLFVYGIEIIIESILEFCELHQMDIQRALALKIAYNRTRPHRHGDKKA